MKTKTVSVLIAAYNVEDTIFKAVRSIIEQTYNNIEIIVVNDGSTDKTKEILSGFEDEITLINTYNHGLGATRNIGLGAATGDYIMFMDGDDYFINSDVIKNVVSVSEKHEADIVVADFNYVNSEGEVLSRRKVESTIEGMYSGAWNKLYDRKLWLTKRFPEGILYEDAGIIMSVGIAANKMVKFNEPIYAYKQSSNTITQSLDSPERHLDVINAISPYIDVINRLSNDKVRRSAINYINHLLLGHLVVVKMEYADSNKKNYVLKELIEYMKLPVFRNGGFSSRFLPDKIQRIMFWTLRTNNLGTVLDVLLNIAVTVRSRRKNKGKYI